MMLEHKHLMVSADFLRNVPYTQWYETWMSGLIEDLDMTPLVEPKAVRDVTVGNEGITAFSIITTSHIVLHTWENQDPLKLQLDVYSCKSFNVDTVIYRLKDFDVMNVKYKFLDRENGFVTIDD
jgi:S-adenosylmethionine/arginine decarboxylase-like enzyme